MKALEGERKGKERKGRRDAYPIRAVWNSILAGIDQHQSLESLALARIKRDQMEDMRSLIKQAA